MVSLIRSISIGDEQWSPSTSSAKIMSESLIHLSDWISVEYTNLNNKDKDCKYVDVTVIDNGVKTEVVVKIDDLAGAFQISIPRVKTRIEKGNLTSMIRAVSKQIEDLVARAGLELEDVKKSQAIVADEDYKVIGFREGKKIQYIRFDFIEFIGDGSNGRVYKIFNLSKKIIEALKIAQEDQEKPVSASIKRELKTEEKVFDKLYGNMPGGTFYTGWQMRPYKLIVIPPATSLNSSKTPLSTFGQLMPYYNQSDLWTFLKKVKGDAQKEFQLNSWWKADACYQLLIGLARFEHRKIWNRDFCLENTFVNVSEGFIQADICDLSNVVFLDEKIDLKGKDDGRHYDYILKKDNLYAKKALNDDDKEKLVEIASKMSVFAMAGILNAILIEDNTSLPYELFKDEDETEYADVSKGIHLKKIYNTPFDQELKTLLSQMLLEDFTKRISAKDTLREFHNLMKEKGDEDVVNKYDAEISLLLDDENILNTTVGEDESPLKRHKK